SWFSNPCYLKKAQQLKPKLYNGRIIEKSDAVVIPDTKETLMLAEESRSKMIEKQKDPQMTEKKVISKPIDYAILHQLSTDFKTRFVPQIQLSAEQAFWSQYSVQTDEPNLSATTTIVEVPKELPKVSMVNSCLKKLKYHLASFDMVVKKRTTTTAITEGTWGFEHTKACFCDDIIPFVKALKELFTSFDQCLIDEVIEVQNVFKQIELAVEQHQFFEINELKAQAQAKDTVTLQLKEKLCSLKGDVTERSVKREVEEIETLNIELDHKVTKLVAENEHLKQTYKQLYDSIKSSHSHAKNDQVADDEFINIFSTLVQDQGETSSRHVDSLNMHTFYQRYPSEHRWTKDHPLEQVIGNPSQSVRTRRQLESDAKMCMFALTWSKMNSSPRCFLDRRLRGLKLLHYLLDRVEQVGTA
nr:hypothetical protein [Tanacetum cinerariifolium]